MDGRDLLEAQLKSKSVGIAAILTFFFGGFGLLYVSIVIGLAASVIEAILWVVFVVTAGFGGILLLPWHILCVVLGLLMASSHNKRLLRNISARSATTNEITG